MDLRDLWRGALSMRRLCVLIEYLQPGNAIERAIDPEQAAWSDGRIVPYILAEVHGINSPDHRAAAQAAAQAGQDAIRSRAVAWKKSTMTEGS